MLELVINRGVPGSGKSTYAYAWVNSAAKRVRSNRDDIRFAGYGTYFGPPIDEDTVTKIQHAGIRAALSTGVSVIVDDCNIDPKYIKALALIGYEFDAKVSINLIDVSLATALKQNAQRDRNVPESVIRSMYNRLQGLKSVQLPEKTVVRPYTNDMPDKEDAIMVDIDGTIAKMVDRGPFEWKRVGEDAPVWPVIEAVQMYQSLGYKVIIMSGRDSECRDETIKWLDKHLIPWDALFMRAEKDMRKDNIVKHELFWAHVANFHNVRVVFDDRNQVVDMWRKIGLTVFQVAPGDF